MPNRILRDGILTSERVCSLSWPAEVFYRRLMSVVDDFGRYYAKPSLLRAACYPQQIDKVSDADVGKWLSETGKAALVSVYQVDQKLYLVLRDFRQQCRAKGSKFPQPPCTCSADASRCIAHAQQTLANAHLDVVVCEGVDEGDSTKSRKRKIPPNFAISDRVRSWAEKNGHSRLAERFEHFVGYAKRSGKTYADWDAAFECAIRENWAKLSDAGPRIAPTLSAADVFPGGE